jgi:hypothetical protein
MRRAYYRAAHWAMHQLHEYTYRLRARAELRLLELTIAEEANR